jgi:hypothetical protein
VWYLACAVGEPPGWSAPDARLANRINLHLLSHVPDFAGTYTGAMPAVTKAVGGSERSRVYQNDKGVIVRITGRFVPGAIGMGDDFDVRLLSDNFAITFRDF